MVSYSEVRLSSSYFDIDIQSYLTDDQATIQEQLQNLLDEEQSLFQHLKYKQGSKEVKIKINTGS